MVITPEMITAARKAAQMTKENFAKYLGVSRNSVIGWEKLTKGEPIKMNRGTKGKITSFLLSGFHNSFEKLENGRYKLSVPVVEITEYEAYLNSRYSEKRYMDYYTYEQPNGYHLAFQVDTKSMDNGSKVSLSFNDIAVGKEVTFEDFSKEYNAEYLWILVLSDTILFQKIEMFDEESNKIECENLNKSVQYKNFELNLSDIKQIFKVVQRVTTF